VNFRVGDETVAYVARSNDSRRHPVVLVVPGNFIAEEYIPNTCVALAKVGLSGLHRTSITRSLQRSDLTARLQS
jgi:dienelactone hydrolase